LSTDAARSISSSAVCDAQPAVRDDTERLRDGRYPIARWYLRPAATWLAARLARSPVRPVHLTVLGLAAAVGAASALLWRPEAGPLSAGLVLLWWFCDRADGLLARRQRTASPYGAWLDANADELADLGLHVAVAAALASRVAAGWPWLLLAAFLAGKHLTMYGLHLEEAVSRCGRSPDRATGPDRRSTGGMGRPSVTPSAGSGDLRRTIGDPPRTTWLRTLYHLPGNADVRAHLLVLALATGYLTAELAFVAVYYNLRWIARHALVARRLGGDR